MKIKPCSSNIMSLFHRDPQISIPMLLLLIKCNEGDIDAQKRVANILIKPLLK